VNPDTAVTADTCPTCHVEVTSPAHACDPTRWPRPVASATERRLADMCPCPTCRGEGQLRKLPTPSFGVRFGRVLDLVCKDTHRVMITDLEPGPGWGVILWIIIVVWTLVGGIVGGFWLWGDSPPSPVTRGIFVWPTAVGYGVLLLFLLVRWYRSIVRRLG
jgi:hypothetical protein